MAFNLVDGRLTCVCIYSVIRCSSPRLPYIPHMAQFYFAAFLTAAQRLRCAAAIFFLVAALILGFAGLDLDSNARACWSLAISSSIPAMIELMFIGTVSILGIVIQCRNFTGKRRFHFVNVERSQQAQTQYSRSEVNTRNNHRHNQHQGCLRPPRFENQADGRPRVSGCSAIFDQSAWSLLRFHIEDAKGDTVSRDRHFHTIAEMERLTDDRLRASIRNLRHAS
jgi:hypothetical protein